MGEYSRFISGIRRPVPTPKRLVGRNGKCVFGTFENEFESMELLSALKPTTAPQLMNRFRLTLWEATEVSLKEGTLLCGLCDMGVFGTTINAFYDKRTEKAYQWCTNLRSRDTGIAPNLIGGSVAEARTPDGFVHYVNDFGNGKCGLSGSHSDKDGRRIEYQFALSRLSKPSIVSIPFGDNRPLYSQKDFFKADGKIVVNGETLHSDADTVAIVDDHRGYYPRRAHYDWVTAMGRLEGGKREFAAVNLTRNQSVDQERYNENLLWLEGRSSPLPPVKFVRGAESAAAGGKSIWTVRDEHDMVNVKFTSRDMTSTITHALLVNVDYYIAFGNIEGYVRDEDGNRYILDGLAGIGEDKTLLL